MNFLELVKARYSARNIPNPDMTREDIIRFHGVIRKCIVQDFTDTEKEQIELRKREMQRVANNNGGKNPILGY